MRGTCRANGGMRLNWRFIPAHAGNMRQTVAQVMDPPVHPRTCGEHAAASGCCRSATGSSPHMRGTCSEQRKHEPHCRFIPAHAGNIARIYPLPFPLPVHPRTCGEHPSRKTPDSRPSGSSPHMRGTSERRIAELDQQRFIPAHAGNILRSTRSPGSGAVHPRTCGEHLCDLAADKYSVGSSPHMRGASLRPCG